MGKPTGFLEYERRVSEEIAPLERIKNFNEFHIPLPLEKQQLQGARCMACGVPFCQYGKMINGMASGCPLNNLCPEWNDLVYTGNWEQAYNRLMKPQPRTSVRLLSVPTRQDLSRHSRRKCVPEKK